MSSSECPSAEELASLLEGRSRFRARRRLLGHLSLCEPCFQVFSAAAQFRADFPEYAVSPTPKAPARRFLGAAAAVALLGAAGAALLLWRQAPSGPEPGAALMDFTRLLLDRPSDPVSDELWPAVPVSLPSNDPAPVPRVSFELGVLVVGIAINLEEGELDEARRRQELAMELLEPIERARASRNALGAAEPALSEIDRTLARDLDPLYYALGKWTEAGRLAARRGDADLLRSPTFLAEGRALRDATLPDAIRRELGIIDAILEDGSPAEPDPARLEEAFTGILRASSGG